MNSLLVAFFSSFITSLLIVRFQHMHGRYSGDHDLLGPQKFHTGVVPRIGGISIAIGLMTATIMRLQTSVVPTFEITLLLCTIPTFAIGLTEDLTKKISVRWRLIFTAIASMLVVLYLGAQITRLDIPGIDFLLSFSVISIVFSIFAITGLANAYNIIDGFNGLASMVGIITLLGLAYVGFVVGDTLIVFLSLIMAGSILGFFILNYPGGYIFLGDGGAYLIGFWIGVLSVLLVARHPTISPWFALLINAYPVLETLFTIYRRKLHQGKSPGQPDGIHFHTLIYRRILNPSIIRTESDWFTANSKTAPYLWIMSMLGVTPAILWWHSTGILAAFFIACSILYVWLYKRIVSFRTPVWMSPRFLDQQK
jgi:UDP-GlcNAc:undecaprenyl-phosphate GlcNAc-1-phosphate transferase